MIRKLILGTASVLALGIGGAALDFSANADEVPNAAPGPAYHWLNSASLSKDDIRWAARRATSYRNSHENGLGMRRSAGSLSRSAGSLNS
jgi:hypothetical protein